MCSDPIETPVGDPNGAEQFVEDTLQQGESENEDGDVDLPDFIDPEDPDNDSDS